jgi:hypothetical protein
MGEVVVFEAGHNLKIETSEEEKILKKKKNNK